MFYICSHMFIYIYIYIYIEHGWKTRPPFSSLNARFLLTIAFRLHAGVFIFSIGGIKHILCVCVFLHGGAFELNGFRVFFQISSCLVRIPLCVIFAYYFVHRSSQRTSWPISIPIHVYLVGSKL